MIKFVYTSNSLGLFTLIKSLFGFFLNNKSQLFKKEIAKFFNITNEQIFLYASARMGLYSTLKSLNLRSSDEVILPGYTCVVVSNAIKYLNAQAVYVDIDKENLNMNYNDLIRKITNKTKAIIIPHNFGIPTTYILSIKKKYPNICIIEDCAHTFGTTYKGQKAGTIGDVSFISHEYSKVITTGMGGTLIVNNKELIPAIQEEYKKCSRYSFPDAFKIFLTLFSHTLTSYKITAWSKGYLFAILKRMKLLSQSSNEELNGEMPDKYPMKMNDYFAYIGYLELKNIDYIINHNKELAREYYQVFKNFSNLTMYYDENIVYVRFPILINEISGKDFDILINKLNKETDFEIGRWFNDVVHPKGSFRYCYVENVCLEGEKISQRIINFPISIHVLQSDIKKNSQKICSILRECGIK